MVNLSLLDSNPLVKLVPSRKWRIILRILLSLYLHQGIPHCLVQEELKDPNHVTKLKKSKKSNKGTGSGKGRGRGRGSGRGLLKNKSKSWKVSGRSRSSHGFDSDSDSSDLFESSSSEDDCDGFDGFGADSDSDFEDKPTRRRSGRVTTATSKVTNNNSNGNGRRKSIYVDDSDELAWSGESDGCVSAYEKDDEDAFIPASSKISTSTSTSSSASASDVISTNLKGTIKVVTAGSDVVESKYKVDKESADKMQVVDQAAVPSESIAEPIVELLSDTEPEPDSESDTLIPFNFDHIEARYGHQQAVDAKYYLACVALRKSHLKKIDDLKLPPNRKLADITMYISYIYITMYISLCIYHYVYI